MSKEDQKKNLSNLKFQNYFLCMEQEIFLPLISLFLKHHVYMLQKGYKNWSQDKILKIKYKE